MNKKSQGLSINVIIIVAIALIVLVVLVAIFTGRLGSFVGGIEAVSSCGDSCSAIGMSKSGTAGDHATRTACTATGNEGYKWLGGKYGDNSATDKGCCCS